MSSLTLDAEALYADLLAGVRPLLSADSVLVGIWSGGAWLAERLQRDLQLPGEHGVISSALHRDDFGSRGLTAGADHTKLPFDVSGKAIVLVDDVLYTGRTIRAALDGLSDYGRAKAIRLAVLIDRGHRELPIEANYVGKRVPTSSREHIQVLFQETDGADETWIMERG